MIIVSIKHKALTRLVEKGTTKGLIEPERLKDMINFILAAAAFDELSTPPNFGFHALNVDRKGTYAMTVTRNWRLTFTAPTATSVADLDIEDYH